MLRRFWLLGLGLALAGSTVATADENPATPPQQAQPIYSMTNVENGPCTGCGTLPGCCTSTSGCGSSCGCAATAGCCGGGGKLFGLIAPSDHGFSGFISPMTNPVYFEDPRTLTEARVIIANHVIPKTLGGGNVQLFAMQARAALTENLSIIATKDGFFLSEAPAMRSGFADVNAGLKYNIYKDYCTQTIVSTGFTYGIPLGSHQALQGRGNGEFNLFLTGGQQIGDDWHIVSALGARLPADNNGYSQSTYFSNHLDRRLGNSGFYLFTEANWYHWLSSGNQLNASFEGLDLFNLGSNNVTGHDIVTGGYGVKYKPNDCLEIGVAYEIPYTERRDIIQDRLTLDLIVRY